MALKVGNGLDLQSQKIISMANPTNPQDAATKLYVDNLANGQNWHEHVRARSATNVTIASPGATVDGVTAAAGDRFLLTSQTTTSQNGLWVFVASGSPMTRPNDYVAASVLTKTAVTVYVTEGTSAEQAWSLTTDGVVTVDTTTTAWVQTGAGITYLAGAGLTLTGTTFDVVALDGSIIVATDTITVGNVPVTKGGTGGTTAATARSGIGAVGKYAATVTTAAATPLTINHLLSTTDVTVALYDAVSTGNLIITDVAIVDANNLTITTAAICSNYRIVVTG